MRRKGRQFLHGEAGNDTLIIDDYAERIDGGSGSDLIDASSLSPAYAVNLFLPLLTSA